MKYFTEYKKPILICIGFLFFMGMTKAQDPSRAKLFLQQKDYARAKETVDSLLSVNGANAATWLLKADIYNAINKDVNARNLVADAGQEAFMALQKAMQLNTWEVNTQLKARDFDLPFDLYNNFTNTGLTFFNAGVERNNKASYLQALSNFKQAGLISRYIYANGWGLTAIDTLNLYYTAKAAINTDKEEDAILNCKKIADAGITETATQTDFETIYQWLVYYYKAKQDEQSFYKYTKAGIKAFQNSSYFTLSYIDWYRQQKDYTNLLAQYKILFAKDDANSKYQLGYYNDIFNYLYQSKAAINNRAAYESQLSKGLLELIKANPVNFDARLLLAKLYINQATNVFKESLLRSTTDVKIMNGYKIAQRNLLLKSNVQLKQIVNKRVAVNKPIYEEAKGLLVLNNIMLK
ncbi:hypothetical protein [Ferruginibacter sp.]|nr:hypothetical protein [Ferruginibacter sp.]